MRPNSFEFLDYCIRCSVNINNGSGKGLYRKILRCNSDLGRQIIQGASSLEREKKNRTIFWRSASLRPALFQEKEEFESLDKTSVKKFETRSNYCPKIFDYLHFPASILSFS